MPAGKGEFQPHPKSMPLYKLATHVFDIPTRGVSIVIPGMYGPSADDIAARARK